MAERNSRISLTIDAVVKGLQDVAALVRSIEGLDDAARPAASEAADLTEELARLARLEARASGASEQFSGALRRIREDSQHAERALRGKRDELGRFVATSDKASRAGIALRRAFAGISTALVITDFAKANDELARNTRILENLTGSSQATAAELDNLVEVSNRLGLELGLATDSYVKLAAATKGTNLEGATTRQIFEDTAAALAGLGASAPLAEQALRAIQQIASKGRVSLEELTGQLGDAIPGTARLAAKALGVTTAELFDMVENGEVMANDLLPNLARKLKDTFGSTTGEVTSAAAAWNRLQNGITRTLQALGQTGAYKALVAGIDGVAGVVNTLADRLSGIGDETKAGTDRAAQNVASIGTAADTAKGKVEGLDTTLKRLGQGGSESAQSARVKELTDRLAALTAEQKRYQSALAELKRLQSEAGGGWLDAILGVTDYAEGIENAQLHLDELGKVIRITQEELDRAMNPALQGAFDRSIELADAFDNLTEAQKNNLTELRRLAAENPEVARNYERYRDQILGVTRASDGLTDAQRRQARQAGQIQQALGELERLYREGAIKEQTYTKQTEALKQSLANLGSQAEKTADQVSDANDASAGADANSVESVKKLGDELQEAREKREADTQAAKNQATAQRAITEEAGQTTEAVRQTNEGYSASQELIAQVIANTYRLSQAAGDALVNKKEQVGLYQNENAEVEKLQRNLNKLLDLQRGNATRTINMVDGLNRFLEKANEIRQQFYESSLQVERLEQSVRDMRESGEIDLGRLEQAATRAQTGFQYVDSVQLDGLRGEIEQTFELLERRVESARDSFDDLQLQLARLRGEDVRATELEAQREIAELQERLSTASGEEADLLRQAITARREILEIERQQAVERERERERQAQYEREQAQQQDRDTSSDSDARTERDTPSDSTGGVSVAGPSSLTRQALSDLDQVEQAQQAAHARELERQSAEREANRQTTDAKLQDIERLERARFRSAERTREADTNRATVRLSSRRRAELASEDGDNVRTLNRRLVGVRHLGT